MSAERPGPGAPSTHSGPAPEARLGNDIARQFAHLGDDEATQRIAAHVSRFWDPRMRRALCALAAAGDDTLDPRVTAAARLL